MSLPDDQSPAPRPLRLLRSRTAATVLALTFCVGLVGSMAFLVLREIDALSTSNSDNLQWSLAQADVEYMQFRLALELAEKDQVSLRDLRRRFDIFYSRLATLESGAVYRGMRDARDLVEPRQNIQDFMAFAVPLIDGPDADLQAALPELQTAADAIMAEVRNLTLAGLAAFADDSDQQRQQVMGTLIRLAAVLAIVLAGLMLLALALWRLNRLASLREAEVQRTAGRMRTIVETSLDAIILSDAEGRIREFNTAAQSIFGYSRAEARQRDMLELLIVPESHDQILSLARHRFDPDAVASILPTLDRTLEVKAMARGGRTFPAELSFDRAAGADGPVYVAFIRDISRRKAAEEGLTEARDRALASERVKAEFLAVMSHEMRTPLNGLLGTMQLLRDHKMTEAQSDLLDHMQSSGQLLLGLVNDVLDLAKFEAGKLSVEQKPMSVKRLLDGVVETISPLAAANGTALSWHWEGVEQDAIAGDARRLRQVLLNLLGNAVKFTRGGSVEIEVETLGFRDPKLEFRVIDTGIGIAEADLERIFLDFETLDSSYARQVGGTGLGLGIARRMTGLMGGTIGAESEVGEGSLFWVRIPMLPVADMPAYNGPDRRARTPQPRMARQAPMTILLVEDNEINRFVARQMLIAEGHEVIEAHDGMSGVEMASTRAFDLILMDISMPVLDGQAAARLIRAGKGPCARTPILAVTAHALPEEVARFREAGMEYCISKPLDRGELLATLAAARQGAAEVARVPEMSPSTVDALLDTAHLERFWIDLPEAAREALLQRFTDETARDIAWFADKPTDDPALQAQAHRIAGSCAAFGLKALRKHLGQIETGLKQSGTVDPALITALPDLWARSHTALDLWCDEARQTV